MVKYDVEIAVDARKISEELDEACGFVEKTMSGFGFDFPIVPFATVGNLSIKCNRELKGDEQEKMSEGLLATFHDNFPTCHFKIVRFERKQS